MSGATNLWAASKKHPVVAVAVSIAIAVAAIVGFLSGLAGIWAAMSRDTVPEFLEKKGWLSGWAMTAPPLIPLVVMVAAVAVLLVLVALWNEAIRQRTPSTVRATKMGYYGDVRRREGDVFTLSSESHFSAKWMERVPPGTPQNITTSPQALLRVEAELRGRNPEEAEAMRAQDIEQALAHSRQAEGKLVGLANQLQAVTIELGATKAKLTESMAEVALWDLERLSQKYGPEKRAAKVTVRFIDFSDGPLADRVVYLFSRYTKWLTKPIRDDGSEIRQPDGMSRVMFESGTPELVTELTIIFNEGNLLKEVVSGREIRERDDYDVVVTIFPFRGVK